jgi:hypothetical protein
LALAVNEVGRVTGQPAPSSSTPLAAGAAARAATTVAAPVHASAATASPTTVERIRWRRDLVITWLSFRRYVIDDHGCIDTAPGSSLA